MIGYSTRIRLGILALAALTFLLNVGLGLGVMHAAMFLFQLDLLTPWVKEVYALFVVAVAAYDTIHSPDWTMFVRGW